ncbi:MAG: hypothetical protein HQ472_11255 [Ignavibacteria bacterium]|nr:hypothetical protein [Ignavibacteria bacterium]
MICILFAVIIAIVLSVPSASAQGFVTHRLLLRNGGSTMSLVNPNEAGTFTFTFPTVTGLPIGTEKLFVLKAIGTAGGVEMQFVDAAPSATIVRTLDSEDGSDRDIKSDGSLQTLVNSAYQPVVHKFAEIDIPLMLPNTTFIAKVDMIGVKAGAAISISPATDMGGLTGPICAWAPIDCVVMIKFSNPGGEAVNPVGMQFAVGAINPMP